MSRELNPSMLEKRIFELERGGGGVVEHLTEVIESVDNSLIAEVDGVQKHFYFDSHDGKLGFNTDEERGADTFHPFSEKGGGAGFVLYENGKWGEVDYITNVQKNNIIEHDDYFEMLASSENGAGVSFTINKPTSYDVVVYFEETPANLQYGVGGANAILPDVITLSQSRISYTNYVGGFGLKIHTVTVYNGNKFFIGKYQGGFGKIKKIVVI